MESLIVLVILITYVAAAAGTAYWAYRLATRRGLRWSIRIAAPILLLAIFWAIPGADHEFGKLSFEALCKRQAGLSTLRTAQAVEGYRTPFATEKTPVDLGFKYVEREESNGRVTRFSVLEGGKVHTERNAVAKSAFALRKQEERIDTTVTRTEYSIVEVSSGGALGQYIQYSFRGGWVARQFSAMHVSRTSCPAGAFEHDRFVQTHLRLL